MGLYAVCIHLVNSYGQEKLHYGNFGLGFVVCIFFSGGCLVRSWLVGWLVQFFWFLQTFSAPLFDYPDLLTHLIQISVRPLPSPSSSTQHNLLEIENGKCCAFISSHLCNTPEQKVLPDMRICASIVKNWSSALC